MEPFTFGSGRHRIISMARIYQRRTGRKPKRVVFYLYEPGLASRLQDQARCAGLSVSAFLAQIVARSMAEKAQV